MLRESTLPLFLALAENKRTLRHQSQAEKWGFQSFNSVKAPVLPTQSFCVSTDRFPKGHLSFGSHKCHLPVTRRSQSPKLRESPFTASLLSILQRFVWSQNIRKLKIHFCSSVYMGEMRDSAWGTPLTGFHPYSKALQTSLCQICHGILLIPQCHGNPSTGMRLIHPYTEKSQGLNSSSYRFCLANLRFSKQDRNSLIFVCTDVQI